MARAATLFADFALLVGLPGPTIKVSQPYVPRLSSVHDVLRVLQEPRARNNPPYVLAVLRAYVRPRITRRRVRLEEDLTSLASQCPEFAPEFRAIMKHYRFPLPASLLADASPGGSPYRHLLPRTRYCGSRGWRPPAVARVLSPSADPPPAYASEDPDPETTAVQALRLASQSRIALGDLVNLAQTSRVDLIGLAERSQVDLAVLGQTERAEQEAKAQREEYVRQARRRRLAASRLDPRRPSASMTGLNEHERSTSDPLPLRVHFQPEARRSRNRFSLPIIPPLEPIGELDFDREFADLHTEWYACTLRRGHSRDPDIISDSDSDSGSDTASLASSETYTRDDKAILHYLDFDEPYDVEIASVMATEG